MELNEFIANFADQFEDTDPLVITAETKFHDLEEWSSLTALLVIGMVLDKYGKNLKADVIRHSETIEDLFNAINEI